MKKLLNLWRYSAMRTKLIIALLCTSLPPLLLAQGVLYSSYQAALKERILRSEQVSSSQTARIFDMKISAYQDLLIDMIADNSILQGARMLDILDESPVVEEVTGRTEIDFHGASAENVTFAHGEETILEDFSVEIPENKIIGIVGRSGSGKSTLLKLFMRFWQVQQAFWSGYLSGV